MFKKLLTVVATVAISAFAANAQAPCTPDPIYADSSAGIWPDSATGLAIAYVGQPYSTVIQLKTLTDTSVTFQGIPVSLKVKALKILDVIGEPAGFTVAPAYNDVVNGTWQNEGTDPNWTAVQGCVLISASQSDVDAAAGGGPNNDGVYPITVYVDVLAKGNPIPSTYTWVSTLGTPPYGAAIAYSDYVVRVQEGNFVVEEALSSNKFDVAYNYPNPFTGATTIAYNTVKEDNITMKVYNMVGGLVAENKYRSNTGKNTIVFDGSKLSAGMYIYTVSNGAETITRKMTIN